MIDICREKAEPICMCNDGLFKLCFIIYCSLNVLRCLLQLILQTEDVIRVFEVRLSEEETVPLDLDKVEAYRACLKVRSEDPRT